jgi:hypothetical protein
LAPTTRTRVQHGLPHRVSARPLTFARGEGEPPPRLDRGEGDRGQRGAMFHDLDSTLHELLTRELPPGLVNQVGISFATPDTQFPPASVTLPAVDLFLYEVQENRDLRHTEPQVARQADGSVLHVPAPVRVDCHYLVTAWAKAGVQSPEQDEHRLLGEVMRILLRHRDLPAEAMQGSLTSQPMPVRGLVSLASKLQGRGDFWQALGGRPRAAFHYTVTLCMDVLETHTSGRVVTSATR